MTNTTKFLKLAALTGTSSLILMGSHAATAQVSPYSPTFTANRIAQTQLPVNAQATANRYGMQTMVNRQAVPNTGYTNKAVSPTYGPIPTQYPALYQNQTQSQMQNQTNRYGPAIATQGNVTPEYKQGFWDKITGKNKQHYASFSNQWRGERLPQYQTRPSQPGPLDQFQQWDNSEPEYKLFPGDQIDIVVSSAPELSRTLTVGPDGRVVMPMTQPVMAAGRTMGQVQADLSAQLSTQLVDPRIAVTPRAYGPQQIFVGGEVAAQGTYTLPGPIGAMESILMAGGFQTSARTHQVVVLRRASNGGLMARTIDFKDGLHNIRSFADNIQMKRGDIIFVPRSNVSEINLFMQNVRGSLPVDFSISYNLGDTFANNN